MSWQLFDRIRAFSRSAGLFQQERIYQDQTSLDRVVNGGEFFDYNHLQELLDQTNLQINRLERYKDYEQMDEVGEVSLALDLYADEASLVDPERKHALVIKAKSKAVKEELEKLFFQRLLIDNNIRPMIRYLCKYGCSPYEMIPTRNRDGISALKFMNVYNFTRIETKYGDLVGFYYQDEIMTQPVFLHPWQVIHMRLTSYDNIYHPYGRSILEGGRKAFKQLRMMEDAALIYRITRAPEKRIFKIPVGSIPAKEVPEFMQQIARQYKNTKFYDPRTGQFNERYSPLIQEDDFFLPVRPDGTGPTIDTLKGAENLDQIKDIEYFKKKMVAPTKIPFKRVGIGEGAGEADEKSLSSSDAEFAKSVQWVQREAAVQFMKVAICHLSMAGFSKDDIQSFTISMSATNAIDELYRMETWSGRASVMQDLKDLEWFPREWIISRFTDLSPDEIVEIEELNTAKDGGEEEGGAGGGGGMGGMGGLGGLGGAGGEDGSDQPEAPEGSEGGSEGEEDAGGLESMGLEDMGGGEDDGTTLDELDPASLDIGEGKISGYNYAAEKKLITEMKKISKMKNKKTKARLLKECLEKLSKRVDNPTSSFDYMVEHNELDGLTRGTGSNATVIVESSLSASVINEAKEEIRTILCGDVTTASNDIID